MFLTASLGLLIGIPLGVVIHRGGFCMHSGFRLVLRGERSSSFFAYLLALGIQMIVVNALAGSQLIRVPSVPLIWLASMLGGLTFGFGMVWAKGWATSIWSRVGTGNIGAGTAVLGLAIGAWLTEQGALYYLDGTFTGSTLLLTTLPVLLGATTAWVVVASIVLIVALLWLLPRPVSSPEIWPWYCTGFIVGVLGTLAWVVGSLGGWHWGLSMIGPSRSLLRVVLDQSSSPLTWGAFMLLGVPLGSWLSAQSKGMVRWQVPAFSEFPRRFLGGFMMGFGGTLAAGCNIGNALTGLSILSLNSLLATAAILLGLALGARVQESARTLSSVR